jgi:phage tail sheath gpL-like
MSIATQVPENWNLPLFWATVDGSQAINPTTTQPALLVGQMYTSGSLAGIATPNVPIAVGSAAQANLLFGTGSMLARMVAAWLNNNVNQLLYCLPVADPGSGVAATGVILLAGTVTAAGVLTIYIAGQVVSVLVASTDTPTSIGVNLAAAINANTQLPVTAVATAGSVALTCTWKGLTGNDISVIPNFQGLPNGEILPAGLTCTVTAMASGAGAPSFTAAIAAIQSYQYLYVGMPYTDSATNSLWNTEFGFGSAGRWNYSRQQYGFICNVYRNDYADALTFGLTINSPVMSTMIVEPLAPAPIWEWAAAYTAEAALGFSDDPARPLQTLQLAGILPASLQNRFSQAELNNLTNGGFAIQAVAPGGVPQILREQTQYQKNSYGQPDQAFALLTVLATLQTLLMDMNAAITTKYGRVKLIPNGTRIGPGQAAVTPMDIQAELISEFLGAQWNGLVSDLTDFSNNLVVEIDSVNPNRVNVLWPPQLAGQLRIFALLAQFRLLYPPVVTT